MPTNCTAQTWREIEELVDQLSQLAQRPIPAHQFHGELLERTVRALAAVGGAVWLPDSDGHFSPDCQIQLPEPLASHEGREGTAHQQLLARAARSAKVLSVPPRSQTGPPAGENPTENQLLLAPIIAGQQAMGVIEVVQHADKSPAVQQGNIELLAAIAQLAADFHREEQLRQWLVQRQLWQRYDQFLWQVHQHLDLLATAYCVANDGRQLVGCDRLSVLIRSGRRWRVVAISGMDTFDRRSDVVQRMQDLVRHAMARGRAWWYEAGQQPSAGTADAAAERLLDQWPAHQLGVLPLREPAKEADAGELFAALVVEQFEVGQESMPLEQRADSIARHAAVALHNALSVTRLPLRPVQQALARLIRRQSWAARVAAAATLVVLAAVMLTPVDFAVEARGQLRPERRAAVYAPYDGVVERLPVLDALPAPAKGTSLPVEQGQPLVVLRSNQLDYELATVLGEKATVQQQLNAMAISRVEAERGVTSQPGSAGQLAAREDELKAQLAAIDRRLEILRAQQAELTVSARLSGRIEAWDLAEKLLDRPVQRGQRLMTIVDADGPWILELQVPDHHIGYVLSARQQLKQRLAVTYVLKSRPDVQCRGLVRNIALDTQVDRQRGAWVLVTVDVDRHQLVDPRPGTTVVAKIHCGRRALAYVWLHEAIDYVRARLFF